MNPFRALAVAFVACAYIMILGFCLSVLFLGLMQGVWQYDLPGAYGVLWVAWVYLVFRRESPMNRSRIVEPKPVKRSVLSVTPKPVHKSTITEARSPKEIDKARKIEKLRKEYPNGVK